MRRSLPNLVTYALLSVVALVSVVLPEIVTVRGAHAQGVPDTIRIRGIVRDFMSTHPDFGVFPAEGYGHCAALVAESIAGDAVPVRIWPLPRLNRYVDRLNIGGRP